MLAVYQNTINIHDYNQQQYFVYNQINYSNN